ncbi:MAG: lamin tail domain-containing protein, partial [Sedimentisphaerales bacterium]|nr:lamin tail domain-containing protein [Sedimentisphaerales bacterium]
DGSTIKLYVDGSAKASVSSAGLTGVSSVLYIGCDYTSDAYFSGYIDDVRIYSRALSRQEFGVSSDPQERWGEEDSWRASAYSGGSPGWDDSGIVPNPGAVVINEILTHSHDEDSDWIELYNTTDSQIDVGGWYLSDSDSNLKKYRFADGTKIEAFDYLVLYESLNFGDAAADHGKLKGFGFSENGEGAYLSSAEEDVLTGYRAVEEFGASYTGVSFGRYFKRSTGTYNFVSMEHNTARDRNSYPAVGPIVINEIMYNPDWPHGGSYGNDRYEYIELKNITDGPVRLWREDKLLPWKFSEGIDFMFPDVPDDVTIAAGDCIVVVRDVAAFTWRYPGVPAVKIFGPYEGALDDGGEQVELSMPGDKDKYGRQHYIRIDRVSYSDGSHDSEAAGGVDLWPTAADADGKSLTRVVPSLYGNDPNNWTASDPSPGQ